MSSFIRFPELTFVVLTWRNMVARRGRTLLTGLGIALGVAVVLAVNITNATLLSSFDAAFDEAGGGADLTVIDRARGGSGFDASNLDRVYQLADTVAAAPAVQAYSLLADDLNQWQALTGVAGTLAAGNQLLLMGVDPEMEPDVREFTLVDGRYLLPDEQRYSIVLVQDYADEHEYAIGDRLPILLPGGRQITRLTIVGLVAQSGAGLINGGAVAFLPLPVAQELLNRNGKLDRIDVVLNENVAETATALAEAKELLSDIMGEQMRVIYPGARGEELAKRMTSYRLGLDMFSTIAMFVGGFLIYNTFAMNIAERTRTIGLSRAVGMTRRQVLAQVLLEATTLSLVGSAAGIGLGLGMAGGMSKTLAVVAGSTPTEMVITSTAFSRSLTLGLGVTLASALGPALQAAGISPLLALRARAMVDKDGKWQRYSMQFGPGMVLVGWLLFNDVPLREAVAWPVINVAVLIFLLGAALIVPLAERPYTQTIRPLLIRIFGHEGKLGAANVQRAQGRTVITVATLMLGIGMNIATVSLGDSFRYDLSRWTEAAAGGDLIVRSPVRMDQQMGQRLAALDGVEVITAERIVEVWTTGAGIEDEVLFTAIEPETRPKISEFIFDEVLDGASAAAFARLRQGDALFISTTLADRYHLEIGDAISLDTPRGVQAFTIAGTLVDFAGNGLSVIGSREDLRRYFGVDDVDRFIIKLTPGTAVDAAGDRIEAQFGERYNLTVEVTEDLLRNMLDIVDQSFVMFDTLALIVVSVSAMGVINTMAISVMERRQEIGMLRSIGFTRRQTQRMILAEAATLGAMGGALGLLLGLALSHMYIQLVAHLAGYELTHQLSLKALISSVIIALVISQIAAYFPAARAAKADIVASLKGS